MNHLSTITNEEGRPEVDSLLREFFQAEMPHPWPALSVPRSARPARDTSVRSRYTGRLALAACIAVLVAGYLTLSGSFPRQQSSTGVETVSPDIGSKEPRTKTPAHGDDHPELLPMK
jgi:hypothetical protein